MRACVRACVLAALAMYTSVSVVTAVSVSLLLLEAVLVSQSAPGGDVTCQAGTFFSGGPATVTCFFNTDVFQTKRDFIVHRYKPDQVGSEAGSSTPPTSFASVTTERERQRQRERQKLRQTDRQTDRDIENSNSKTLFYKDCILGSVKNLSNS